MPVMGGMFALFQRNRGPYETRFLESTSEKLLFLVCELVVADHAFLVKAG